MQYNSQQNQLPIDSRTSGKPYYCEEKEQVLEALHLGESGLSEEEAKTRLEIDGYNRLEAPKR